MARMARLFVAVWPPEEVVEHLTSLHRKDQRGVRFVPPENWHVTLRFLGESAPAEALAALDGIAITPTRARIGPAVDVLAARALVLAVVGVDEAAAEVERRTAHIGEPPRKRFVGHLTLARLKRHATMPRTLGALVDVEFDVTEIALVQSRLDPRGAHYETLETWPTR